MFPEPDNCEQDVVLFYFKSSQAVRKIQYSMHKKSGEITEF